MGRLSKVIEFVNKSFYGNHGDGVLKNVFLFGLLISFFVFWPASTIPFEIPKVSFIYRWTELLAILTIFNIPKLKKNKLDRVIIGLIIIFLIEVLLSAYFGANLGKSVIGNYYRGDGILTLFHLLIVFFVLVLYSSREWTLGFVKVASISSILLSLISIGQWLINSLGISRIPLWDGGYGHVFGNPNFLAGFLIVTLPMTTYFVDSFSRNRNLFFLGLFFQILGILLTNAWVGYFGILLFGFCWLITKYKKFRILSFFGGLLLFLLLVSNYYNYQQSLETPISINPESRTRIMMKALLAIPERPLLGYGWANFDKAFEKVDWPIHMNSDVYVDKAHSTLLEMLTTTGILGLVIYVAIIIRILVNLVFSGANLHRYILATFVLLIFHMQTNVISISEEILFWVIAGISAKTNSRYKK